MRRRQIARAALLWANTLAAAWLLAALASLHAPPWTQYAATALAVVTAGAAIDETGRVLR